MLRALSWRSIRARIRAGCCAGIGPNRAGRPLGRRRCLEVPLSANMSETVTPWKFRVEGEAGLESDERTGAEPRRRAVPVLRTHDVSPLGRARGGAGARHQLRHPVYAAPELLARRPNELWSWDITKLLGPAKWTYFYLYVMLDVFSRYVVGWMVFAGGKTATLAEQFIRETCARHGIGREQLTIHADRGQAMVSKSVAFLLADLGVTKTHSRPTCPTTTRFRKRSSRRSSTGRRSRNGSARSKTPGLTGTSSSPVQSPQAARARGGGAHSLNSITDCLIPIDRLRLL